jgi:hypothetical protein
MLLKLVEEPSLLGDVEIWDVVRWDPVAVRETQVAWFFDKDLARTCVNNFNKAEEELKESN